MFTWRVRSALLLALVLALLLAVPVSAAGPIVETGGEDVDFLEPAFKCPGLEVRNHEVYTYVMRMWLDDQDNVLRIESHYDGIDTFYNPENPGAALSAHWVGNGYYNARTGQNYITGGLYHVTIPGYGTALVRAGRWLAPEYPFGHIAGKDSFDSPKDMAQFCAYLVGD